MRSVLAIVLVAMLGWLAPASAADAPSVSPSDREAIAAVIRDQLAAFQHDDAAAAFSFASPTIQGLFGHDPEQFMSMVRSGYQPVYRPRSTRFGETDLVEGRVVQHLDVDGPDGVSRTALYTMEQEADGTWRINGCTLTDAGGVGT